MSLVTDLMNKVSPLQQGGNFGAVSGVNLNDTTFANLLDKALNVQAENNIDTPYMNLGAPLGLDIQELNLDNNIVEQSEKKITENLMDFAKKQAANSYFKYSGSVVTDISEFVEDALTQKVTNFIASPM